MFFLLSIKNCEKRFDICWLKRDIKKHFLYKICIEWLIFNLKGWDARFINEKWRKCENENSFILQNLIQWPVSVWLYFSVFCFQWLWDKRSLTPSSHKTKLAVNTISYQGCTSPWGEAAAGFMLPMTRQCTDTGHITEQTGSSLPSPWASG